MTNKVLISILERLLSVQVQRERRGKRSEAIETEGFFTKITDSDQRQNREYTS